MLNCRVISSDNHVFEPGDLWTTRIDSKYRDRAPHIERLEDGSDHWFCDGQQGVPVANETQTGDRFENPEDMDYKDTVENIVPGGYIPEEHVKDMDADGVDVGILYPTIGLLHFSLRDSELVTAVFKPYNDWLAEFCGAYPERLKGIAMVNIDDIDSGISELERCAKMGLAGAMITVYPPEDRSYRSPIYEPLWAAAQDLDIPLSLHIGTNRPGGPSQEFEDFLKLTPSFFSNVDHWVRMSLGHMIFSGVFERYPKLKVGSIEMELGWIPHFLNRMDYTYSQRPSKGIWSRFQEDMLPSDYFHRNVFLGFNEDALGVRDRHMIGVDNILWGSDYPHIESAFPKSMEILEEILVDCTEEEKAKIVGGNAARIYGLD